MQELQVKVIHAQVEIIDREKFEQNINEVVTKYQNYTVTASTIKDDKQVLADLRKLKKQISDERIKIKRELSQSADEFDKYIKDTSEPMDKVIDKIASDVKEFEEHQKAVRLDTVKSYLANQAAEYMLDHRLFDEKALEYIKASDFMADGFTLKKVTMKSLDDMVTFEFQKQQEYEKAKSAISGQCAEYGMTDQPYIHMLQTMTLADVLQQIMSDYHFEQEKQKVRKAEAEKEQFLEAQQKNQHELAQKSTETRKIDPETGEILDGWQLYQNELDALRVAENEPKRYTQKMTLEVYFTNASEKDLFKTGFSIQPGSWTNTTMFIRVNSLKRFTAIYGAAGSAGYLYSEPIISTLAVAGFMYKGKIYKNVDGTLIAAAVYAPYSKYYTESWFDSKPIIIPFFNVNYKLTKTFGFGLTGGGTYLAGANVLNYQVLLGAKLIL